MANAGNAQRTSPAARLDSAAEKWVQSTLRRMTLDEKIGQLVMVFYFGGFTSAESDAYQELLRQVEQNHAGGLVISTRPGLLGTERSQVYPAAAMANALQRRAKVPLLVGADFERGTAMRLEDGTEFPPAMAVAATGEPKLAYEMGRITALESRAMGVHWVFAPVADVNSNPANPIINTRSFGEDPARVGEFAAAFVRGVEEHGALSTTKHFPGHGDTSVDSHIDISLVTADRARLEQIELPPFRAAIAAGTSTIMTGHLAVPSVEPNAELPATMSESVLTGLLRTELGFQGLIVTDALDMGGVTSRYAPGEVAVRSILAGADVLLVPPVTDAAIAALKEAVADGRITEARINASVERILRAKARLGLHIERQVKLDELPSKFGTPEFRRTAAQIADRGVTLLRDTPRLLPLNAAKPLRLLLVSIAADGDAAPGVYLEREIRWRADAIQTVRVDTRFSRVENAQLPPPDSYDVAVAALIVRVVDRKATIGLPENQAAFLNQLLATGKPVVVVSFGSPYLIESFPNAPAWLSVFSTGDVVQRAAGRALFGQVATGGKMPVSVPGVAALGDGLQVAADPMLLRPAWAEMEAKLRPAYELLERAATEGAFPGGVLAVGYKGDVAVRPFGKLSTTGGMAEVSDSTIYDVASLTKPVVTTTLASMLVSSGRLALDAPVSRYLPEWASGPHPEWRAKVTLRHLLQHTAGLPPFREWWRESLKKRDIIARICAEPLEDEPGTKVVYSDLGFILLGEIVERFSGRPLDALARERIFAPLGMNDSWFNPPQALRERIAPTEDNADVRRRLLRGEVHDPTAAAMGGVAGHAGVFSTARDLAAFAQMLLNGGIYGHQRVLRRDTIRWWTARQTIGDGARALGWDVPTEPSSSGKHFSPHSFGHNGFTGTSLWVDPEKELFVVLLTNRVHPHAQNERIREIRPALHDAIIEALGLAPTAAPTPVPSK